MARKRHHPETVKSRLRIAYGSVSAFERRSGLPTGSVRDVLRGRTSRRTMQAILAALNIRPGSIIIDPARPISGESQSTNRDCSDNLGMAQRQNGEAA